MNNQGHLSYHQSIPPRKDYHPICPEKHQAGIREAPQNLERNKVSPIIFLEKEEFKILILLTLFSFHAQTRKNLFSSK